MTKTKLLKSLLRTKEDTNLFFYNEEEKYNNFDDVNTDIKNMS